MQSSTRQALADVGALRCPVGGRGMLQVQGLDAADFLHSQFSSDIRGLVPGQVRLTSYSDARGRLLAVMRVCADADRFLLELPADRLDPATGQLRRFVLRASVEITNVSPGWSAFGLAGAEAEPLLADRLGSAPPAAGQWIVTSGDVRVAGIEGPRPRWLVFGPPAGLEPAWAGFDALPTVPAERWDLLDIEAGIPAIHEATAGRFVAQMVNLDRLDALDFRKGCFPGQEVIARTRYLGRIKRRMFPLRLPEGARLPTPGEPVIDTESGDSVGELVRAARHPDGGALALAVLRLDAIDVALALADGTHAIRLDPPYPLDEAA